MGESHEHQVGEHLDVVVVVESVLHVLQELEDVDAVEARVEQRVHALERRLVEGDRNGSRVSGSRARAQAKTSMLTSQCQQCA